MTDPGLAAMIREVLGEELAKLKPVATAKDVTKEPVSITNDAELNAFARDLMAKMSDPAVRRNFEAGRLKFSLSPAVQSATRSQQQTDHAPIEHRIDKGFLTERQIDKLPSGTKRLLVGKAVRLTPLARDRARQRGVVIERMEQ